MQWWLTVVLLLNSGWVSGDQLEDSASRTFADYSECERRPPYADQVPGPYDPDAPSPWVRGEGRSVQRPPQAPLNDEDRSAPPPVETHWYEPPNPLGLEIFTHEKVSWMADDAIGFRYTGPLQPPFAARLRELLLATPQKYNRVILELDSDGGELGYVEELVSVLKEVRKRTEFTTRVTEGSLCASGCIPLFMQGRKRKASGSSIWVFHGARGAFTNLPSPAPTEEYLTLLSEAGMTSEFRSILEADGRIYKPGTFVFSGHELFDTHKAGIITELFPTWRAEEPVLPTGGIGPH